MIELSYHQSTSEFMVRLASSFIFAKLISSGIPLEPLKPYVHKPQYGHTATSSHDSIIGYHYVRITDLKDGSIDWSTVPYCECENPENYLLIEGDILFARTGATTGKTHLVKQPNNAVFASYLIRVRPKQTLTPEYLYSFFQSNQYWEQIIEEKRGSAQPNVNATKLAQIKLPIVSDKELQAKIYQFLHSVKQRSIGETIDLPEMPAPLEDLPHIVAHIEALARRIEEARGLRQGAIEEALELLDTARFEALDFEGDTIVKDYARVTSGYAFKSSWYSEDGIRLLRNANISHGVVDWSDVVKLPYSMSDEFERFTLSEDDILVSLDRPIISTGLKVAKVTNEDLPSILVQRVGKFNFHSKEVLPEYMMHWLQSKHFIDAINPGRSNGVPHISQKDIESIPFSPPEKKIQEEIVEHLQVLESKIKALQSLQSKTQSELEALLPSILDKAFKGEL